MDVLFELILDPRFLGVLFASVIVPIIFGLYKKGQKTRAIMILIASDLDKRLKQLDDYIPLLKTAIRTSRKNNNYLPCVFDTAGYDYMDWKSEKWLLHLGYASRVLDFYNDECSITGLINFSHTESFKALARERKIALYELILTKMEELRDEGYALLKKLHFRGWRKMDC